MFSISDYYRIIRNTIIFLSAVLLYANTFNHDYALDDAIVITENIYTREGISGLKEIFKNDSFTGFFKEKKELVPGGRYRPFSIATFAVEYEIFGKKPQISHIINALLYALTGILIFVIFSKLIYHGEEHAGFLTLPFVCALLFIFHPVHTEVVANIKGRDELFALLLSLCALLFTVNFLHSGKIWYLILSGVSFLTALLSKENAIVFIFLIPLTVYYFTQTEVRKALISALPLLISAAVFLIIRQIVLGEFSSEDSKELMNNPFLNASLTQRYATIFYTLGNYIRLLFYPYPLTYDYYPYHICLTGFNNPRVILSVIFYIIIIIIAITGIKSGYTLSYGIWFYLLPLIPVSNLIFNVGTFMNERFIYISSLGFCIVFAYILTVKLSSALNRKQYEILLLLILVPILTLYSIKTISRNKAWKDDFTLFTTDVKTSSNSAKGNCTAGGILLEKAQETKDSTLRNKYLKQSLEHLNKAIKIHPVYVDALRLLGNAYYELNKDINKSIYYYKQVLKRNPDDEVTYNNIHVILNKYDSIDHKISIYEEILKINTSRFDINYKLGNLYGRYKNNIPKALAYLKTAASVNPDNKDVCKDLGVAYGMAGQPDESIKWLEKATTLDPYDYTIYINLGITYQRMGNFRKASEYFIKAEKMKNE
jgi:tetratricopeptide (TPR) repeat protein